MDAVAAFEFHSRFRRWVVGIWGLDRSDLVFIGWMCFVVALRNLPNVLVKCF